jgi:hypothetical protein
MKNKIVYMKKGKGVVFIIKETGQNWTIYVKENGSTKFERVQSVVDLKIAKQMVDNQKEFKK